MTRIVAHRGLHHDVPENSLAAFAGARDLGLDGVELDVRASSDGVLVVHHDPDVNDRAIDATPSSALVSLASLGAALEECRGIEVNVEVKMDAYAPDDPRRTAFLESVVATVGEHETSVSYSSFDLGACLMIARLVSPQSVGWLLDVGDDVAAAIDFARDAGFAALHPHYSDVDEAVVSIAHSYGLAVNVWTPNAEADLVAMLSCGVDTLITDEPELARLLISKAKI